VISRGIVEVIGDFASSCGIWELGCVVILKGWVNIRISSRVFYEEGIEKGEERGEERGIIKGEIETALKLINEFLPLDMISRGTGLNMSFITELKNRPNIDLDSALSLYYELKR
jgi:hypothetical protein